MAIIKNYRMEMRKTVEKTPHWSGIIIDISKRELKISTAIRLSAPRLK